MTKPIFVPVFIRKHEPTDRQRAAGNYKKRLMQVGRLKIRIENEPGSVRRSKPGVEPGWEVRMKFPYGYIMGSRGVDGDEVDCYVGAFLDAPMVYVIHQRRAGRWRQYDEDKCMIGFGSEEDAKAAYLQHYNDRRFLGPVTAMPVAEFERKVMATKDNPAMIKAIFVVKSHVKQHTRTLPGGKVVVVMAHDDKRRAKVEADDGRQLALFVPPKKAPPFAPEVAANPEKHTVDMFDGKTAAELPKTKKFYVTMVRDPGPRQKVGWLAGPFDTHEEAKRHVEPARAAASKADPFSDFDAFGTASRESDRHPPGVLNRHLGIGEADEKAAESPKPAGVVPPRERERLKYALDSLREIAGKVEDGRALDVKFGGEGRYVRDTVGNRASDISTARKVIERFRKFAPEHGVDADALIRELGGEAELPAPMAKAILVIRPA